MSLFLISPEQSPLYASLGITDQVLARVQSTSSCLAVSSATLLTGAMLILHLTAGTLRRLILPCCLAPEYWRGLSSDNQRRTVWKFVALVLRLDCFVMLLGVWQHNFSYEAGLVFDSLEGRGEDTNLCNHSSTDTVHVRGYFVARILMAVLMFWELGYVPRLEWDDWAHHIITLAGTIGTADTIANRSANPTAAELDAVGFCMLFGGATASFNYWFLLAYQFSQGRPRLQGAWFLCASVFSCGWQTALFVVVPGRVLWAAHLADAAGERRAVHGLAFGVGLALWVVDSKANWTRLQVTRRKWWPRPKAE